MRPIAALTTLLLFLSAPVPAHMLDDVSLPDQIAVAGETAPLALNGAGYRKKFFIKVYVGAPYLASPSAQVRAVLDGDGARVMRLHFLRDIDAQKLANGWKESVAANTDAALLPALQARLAEMNTLIGAVRTGDVLRLEMNARGETAIWVNDQRRGAIRGADFQKALLRTWLGEHPADADLKKAVLGRPD